MDELINALASEHQAELLASLGEENNRLGLSEGAGLRHRIPDRTPWRLTRNRPGLKRSCCCKHILQVNRAWLLTHENDALQPNIHAGFEALLKRRLSGEPVAYILGKREFYGLEFIVTPDTLIPRPDTETLVEAALEKIPADQTCTVLDLGTGSGAIAIAIARHRPQAKVTAVDQSHKALAVAQGNAKRLEVANVQFVLSDWFATLQRSNF